MAFDKVIDSAVLDAGMTATAEAIRGKTGQADSIPWEGEKGFSRAVEGIETGGGENLLDYVITADFGYSIFDVDEIAVVFGAKAKGVTVSCPSFYTATGMRYLKVDFVGENTNTTTSYDSKFRYNKADGDTLEIIELPIIEKIPPTSLNRAFQDRKVLKEIRATIDATNCNSFGNNGLANCYKLEVITFKAETIKVSISFSGCSALSDDSIQSIIDGLADLTGGTAQTLSLHSTVGAKLTDAQKAAASAKNWTISY